MDLTSPHYSSHYLLVPQSWAQHHFLGCPQSPEATLITLLCSWGWTCSPWMSASAAWVGEQRQAGCDRWPWMLCLYVTSQEVPGPGVFSFFSAFLLLVLQLLGAFLMKLEAHGRDKLQFPGGVGSALLVLCWSGRSGSGSAWGITQGQARAFGESAPCLGVCDKRGCQMMTGQEKQ